MPKGKQTCKILKEIRKQIAVENDIELVISECTYQGDCAGTCPKCEAEVRYLEQELEKRQRLGKAVMISGLAVSTMLGAASCRNTSKTPLQGDVARIADSIEYADSIAREEYIREQEAIRLQGEPIVIPAGLPPVEFDDPEEATEELKADTALMPVPLMGDVRAVPDSTKTCKPKK